MTRQHAVMTMADSLYYSKFRDYCGVSMTLPHIISYFLFSVILIGRFIVIYVQPGVESNKNCIADEHYLPTFFYVRICSLSFFLYLFLSIIYIKFGVIYYLSDA